VPPRLVSAQRKVTRYSGLVKRSRVAFRPPGLELATRATVLETLRTLAQEQTRLATQASSSQSPQRGSAASRPAHPSHPIALDGSGAGSAVPAAHSTGMPADELLQQCRRALEAETERRLKVEQELHEALVAQERTAEELRAARDELAHAHRVKSEFVAVMSHELRTPLNAIIGYRDLLSMEVGGPLTDDQQVFLERIRRAATQLLSLIDQVLNVARIEADAMVLEREEVDIAATARDIGAMMLPIASARGLELNVDAPASARCECDPVKLRQILLNLVSNAVKFTPRGRVRIDVREDPQTITVEVRDTGVGIAGPDLSRIFDRFVQLDQPLTRRYDGTGLGLSVCRDLARLMGADLSVQSIEGVGSTFSLQLARQAPLPSLRTPGSTGSAPRSPE